MADAVWDDRRVAARYRRGADEVVRELEPYGLVLKAGVWYVCARVAGAAGDGPFRVYRIDRFTAVEAGEERFVRDDGFDLPAFWAERAEQFARSILRAEVVVRLSGRGCGGCRTRSTPCRPGRRWRRRARRTRTAG